MNKKLIRNTILFAGIAGVSVTSYMINTEAKNNLTSINSYNTKSQIVDIPDANLKKGINNALGRGQVLDDITVEDMEKLNSLSLQSRNIVNLKGLQYAINLTRLDLNMNQISDISYLANLTKLTYLTLSKNQISEISHLDNLVNLTTLSVSYNQIQNITGLDNLINLTSLSLNSNQISEIVGLNTLVNLTAMSLNDNRISEISGLENLTKLKLLHLHNNQISSISGLDNLISLNTLYLNNNQISSISGLENLTSLNTLYLNNNQISSISGLENLTSLNTLYLNDNQISSISGLDNLTKLKLLHLHNNQISSIPDLDNLSSLTTLHLYNNQIQVISSLESLTSLNTLHLYNNQISDISFLENLTSLTELQLSNNRIIDISILKNLTNLNILTLSNNQLSNISIFKNLTNLTSLALSGNQITDISALENLTSLNTLNLYNNQISDISVLENLINLNRLELYDNQISDISSLGNLNKLINLQLQNNQISDISPLNNLTKLNTLYLTGQKISKEYMFKTNTGLTDISADNVVKGFNSEDIGTTSISNSGRYENGKLFWDNVTLGKKVFTSNFNQSVQLGNFKTTFSGTVTYNIDVVDGEGPTVDNEITINEEDFTISATISAEDLLSEVDYLIHKGERHSLPYTFNYDVFNKENNIVEVYDTVGNMTTYEVTADLLDLEIINSLLALLEENDNSPEVIAYIRAIINNMGESANKDLLNDKINNLNFDMTLDRLTASANVDIYIKCENLLSMTLDTNMITFENYSSAEDMEKSEAIAITVNSSLPYQLNAYLPTEIQNADGTKTLDKSIFNIKESGEDEYKKFTNLSEKVVLKDNCEKGNDIIHLIDLKLSSDSAHDADVYKTTIKFEIEQK